MISVYPSGRSTRNTFRYERVSADRDQQVFRKISETVSSVESVGHFLLNARCNSEANYDKGWCAGYLGSWADGDIDMVRRKACIPSDTSIGTLKKVLMDYAEAKPRDVETMSGGKLLQRAFSRKWPTDSTDDTVSEIFRKTC